jgi:NAD-dependent DNA ligase
MSASASGGAARRAAWLRREIRRHDRLYYEQARPEISDAEYDALIRKLRHLEERYPMLATPTSPTQRPGGRHITAFAPVVHRAAMLSLESVTEPDEVSAWERRVIDALGKAPRGWMCEPKVDGVGVALVYDRGRLVRGATRGDGAVGEDVTANLRMLPAVPATLQGRLSRAAEVEVRGEVFMPRAAFGRLNRALEARGAPTFANPRNAAAGSLRQKNPAITAQRSLDLFVHHVSYVRGAALSTQREALAALAEAGFRVNPRNRRVADDAAVLRYAAQLAGQRERLPYEADGVVVKVDDIAEQERLGSTSHHPRWAIALKFAARQATTVVRAIDVLVGKTGTLTPVATLAPVAVGGVTIRRASLHNEDEIRRKDIRVGDNLIAAIAASKDRGLARLLNALGIRFVGAHVAHLLADRFGRLERLIRADAGQLATAAGIGPTIAESVAKFFSDGANREVCRRLLAAGVRSTQRKTPHGAGSLAGKTFVLTGTLHGLTRDEAAERIRDRGGRVMNDVSRATDYVVVGAQPGTKVARARALGVPMLGEDAFGALVS